MNDPGIQQFELAMIAQLSSRNATAERLPPPTSSANVGGAGIALFLLRAARSRQDPDLLTAAQSWADEAEAGLLTKDGLNTDALGFHTNQLQAASIHHGAAGVHYVSALVALEAGRMDAARTYLDRFISCGGEKASDHDLVFGRPGTLLAIASLLDVISSEHDLQRSQLVKLGDALADSIEAALKVDDRGQGTYLGFAHGCAGRLYAILRWLEITEAAPGAPVRRWLDALRDRRSVTADGAAYWPLADADRQPPWPGWCHGTAGYVHLWSQATTVVSKEYMPLVEEAALGAWSHPQRVHGDLCCGLAGRAYALLNAYQLTGDDRWIERARDLTYDAVSAIGRSSLVRPESLYRGRTGVALLVTELADPRSATMPFLR
jgi:serine/threonine-protein kinase